MFFLTCVKTNFTLHETVQISVFHFIFEILDIESIEPELQLQIHRTILSFFGISSVEITNPSILLKFFGEAGFIVSRFSLFFQVHQLP